MNNTAFAKVKQKFLHNIKMLGCTLKNNLQRLPSKGCTTVPAFHSFEFWEWPTGPWNWTNQYTITIPGMTVNIRRRLSSKNGGFKMIQRLIKQSGAGTTWHNFFPEINHKMMPWDARYYDRLGGWHPGKSTRLENGQLWWSKGILGVGGWSSLDVPKICLGCVICVYCTEEYWRLGFELRAYHVGWPWRLAMHESQVFLASRDSSLFI